MDPAQSQEAQRAAALRRLSLLAAQLPSEHSGASSSRSVCDSPAAAAAAPSTSYMSVTSEPSSYARHGYLNAYQATKFSVVLERHEVHLLQGLLQDTRGGVQGASAVEAGPCGAPERAAGRGI